LHNAQIIQGESGASLVPPEQPVSHMPYEEIEKLEKQFRTTWAKAEQDMLWNLIDQQAK
jgi:hypothetical protein